MRGGVTRDASWLEDRASGVFKATGSRTPSWTVFTIRVLVAKPPWLRRLRNRHDVLVVMLEMEVRGDPSVISQGQADDTEQHAVLFCPIA
jgi:hypothetical protein